MKQILLMIGMVTLVGCGEPKATPVGDRQPMPKDFKTLKTWAKKGDANAQNNLGLMYVKGQGVEQDFKEAVKWYQKAADQGNAKAQSNLGVYYYTGQGGEQDFKEALKWCRKAADQGNAAAQANLGRMYANGEGVLQDYETAYAWWDIAATNGNQNAKNNKSIIAGEMTPDQITKAEELVKEMVEKNPKLLK